MQSHDIIREIKCVSVLTDKKLKQSWKGLDSGHYLEWVGIRTFKWFTSFKGHKNGDRVSLFPF